ncbi:hypothetical protein [Mesorhizobium argentiipisi]|uniref:DUF4365 domain-containing protein n=1 Tax=Mesorhizobium argentiipisi TaxID=3015175 RepID=A0ABU8KMH9_9HYPH
MTKNRLPRVAETGFAYSCNFGALCHPTEADENGWDYFVEFDDEPHAGPEDTRPPHKVAYVQVKSTTARKLVAPIKVSNMLKAARSTDPWFVFLFVKTASGCDPKVYGRHFWADLMGQGLKASRLARRGGVPMHRRSCAIKFQEEDRIPEPREIAAWMKGKIDALGARYAEEKTKLYKSIGFEDGVAQAKITVKIRSESEVAENFLGLGQGLELSRFTVTPMRFGIADSSPTVDLNNGKIFIDPLPSGECELRLVGKSGRALRLKGRVYTASIPAPEGLKRFARISAPPMEIVCNSNPEGGGTFECKISLENSKRYSFPHLERYSLMCSMIASGRMKIDILRRGEIIYSGAAYPSGVSTFDAQRFGEIVQAVKTITERSGRPLFEISVNDVAASFPELHILESVASDRSVKIEHSQPEAFPDGFDSMLYYACAPIGEKMIGFFAKRQKVKDRQSDRGRELFFSKPEFLDYICQDIGSYSVADLVYEYKQVEADEPDTVLSFGNIADIVRPPEEDPTTPYRRPA